MDSEGGGTRALQHIGIGLQNTSVKTSELIRMTRFTFKNTIFVSNKTTH